MRPFDPTTASKDDLARLHKLAPAIKDRMQREGTAMVGFQPLDDLPNFFRMLFINPVVTPQDIDDVLTLIDCYGQDLGQGS